MFKITELQEERAGLVEEQRGLVDLADGEKRELTAEEETRYQAIESDFEELTTKIDTEKNRAEAKRSRLAALEERENALKNQPKAPVADKIDDGDKSRAEDEYEKAFNRSLICGLSGLTRDEYRALSAGTDTEGGYLTVPEQFITSFISSVDDLVYVRQKATTFGVPTAASLGVPTLDSDPGDADWTSELLSGDEDSDMDFGKRSLHPHALKKRLKVSEKLIRMAPQNVDKLVKGRLAYKFGVTHEKAFLTGTGANQPLGLLTASDNGISTGRDISTGNTATGIKTDGLIDAKFSLKAQYQAKAEWLFHRDAVKMIRKLKDGNGDYLWKQGLSDKPDTILELPYHMSEYVSNTFTTGLYVGIIGDLSFYWIADALNMTIKVADQLYLETGQIGYFGNMESDGMPVLEEAFARVTLA